MEPEKQTCKLGSMKCTGCAGMTAPLSDEECQKLLTELEDNWQISSNLQISKEYKFKNFKLALDFVNRIGELAEQQGHHPDIYLAWGKVQVTLTTHKVKGLTKDDFILAAGIDRLKELS